MKRLFKLMVAVSAVVASCGAWADTWTDEFGNVWTFSTSAVSSKVKGVSAKTANLVVPDTFGRNPVTMLDENAFEGQSRIEHITIPATVTAIQKKAFLNCGKLKSVTINGSNLETIGEEAFKGCASLASFVMPNSVTSVGVGAFSGCSAMETITLSDGLSELAGVDYVGNSAPGVGKYSDYYGLVFNGAYDNGVFYNCSSLKTINWGKGIKKIGNIAFLNCTALEKVVFPDTVTEIGYHAFVGCSGLHEVNFGNGVAAISRMAFRALPNLRKVTFGKMVSSIGTQAFQDCENLQNFTLPNSIQYLRSRCFAGCSKALTAVEIPTNIDGLEIKLGEGVFSGCTKLETVTLGNTVKTLTGVEYVDSDDPDDGKYSDRNGVNFLGSYDDGMFYNCTSLKTINWGSGVTTIGNIAFLNCTALDKVEIPDNVTTIGYHVFVGCSGLQEVKLGEGIKVVSRMAFCSLPNLKKVTFGAKMNEIQQQAFQDCENLQNFRLPDTIQYLRFRCFAGCSKALTAVTIPANTNDLDIVLGEGVFSGCTKLETVAFSDTIRELTGVGYMDNSVPIEGLYSDYYGEDLRGAYTNGLFYNCTSLKNIKWGNGIKVIGNIAFLNCTSLTHLTLPDGITEIGRHAFFGCSSLSTVTVKKNLYTLGRYAFGNCKSLRYVDFQGATITTSPGYMPFAFDSDNVRVYAAIGSTGWTGTSGVGGLPESGMWCGAKIAYGPAPIVVEFNANGGTGGEVREIKSGAAIGTFPVVTRTSHTFDGWYTDAYGGTEISVSTKPMSNVTYYAHWTFIPPEPVKYTVTFNANGGAGSTTRQVPSGEAVGTLPTATRSGYTFDGWYTAANGGSKISASTKVTGDVTYYAHWTAYDDGKSGNGGGGDSEEAASVVTYGGVVENVMFYKAQTVLGALYERDELVGTMELKFGKAGAKGIKVSGTATLIADGKSKKISSKAVRMSFAGGAMSGTLSFKDPIGNMAFALASNGTFTLKNSSYEMVGAAAVSGTIRPIVIGGTLAKGIMKFDMKIGAVPDFGSAGTILNEALPQNVSANVVSGKKLDFGKAASLKYAKNKVTGKYELLGLGDAAKPNLSGLKLTYTPKTGLLKGSFKLHVTNAATTPEGKSPKLKKYTVNVIGFIVDGVGYGQATLKKPVGGPWSVTVK